MLLALRRQATRSQEILRHRPGYYSAFAFFSSSMGYIFYCGPEIESKVVRYALAGTAATIFVELMTHAVDTVNMNAKVVKEGQPKVSMR